MRPALSLPAITADSNACRHPTNEVINPVAPDRIPCGFPWSHQTGIVPPFTPRSLLQVIRNSKKGPAMAVGWHRCVTWLQHVVAAAATVRTDRCRVFGDIADTSRRAGLWRAGLHPFKKVDPPGGTTGRVGFSTEVDEAPVLDTNPREAFSSEVVFRFA